MIAENFGNLGNASVFQAEVFAIQDSLLWLISNPHRLKKLPETCLIQSDSKAAIQAVYGNTIDSKVVKETVTVLQQASKQLLVHIGWIKGHADYTGNELADYLAKSGTEQVQTQGLPASYAKVKRSIMDLITGKWNRRFHNLNDHKICRKFYPKIQLDKWKKLTCFKRKDFNLLFQVTTGHGFFAAHLAKWRNIEDECKLCLEDEESSWHIYTECPALTEVRTVHQIISSDPDGQRGAGGYEKALLRYFKETNIYNLIEGNKSLIEFIAKEG